MCLTLQGLSIMIYEAKAKKMLEDRRRNKQSQLS